MLHKSLFGLSLALSVSGMSYAVPQKGELSPALSYELGGYSKRESRTNRSIPAAGALSWDNNIMCGNFDMSLSVTNAINGVSGELKKLQRDLLASATGIGASLLWVEMARSDPTLYETFQQGKLEASELFDVSVASCEATAQDLVSGGSGEDWVKYSTFDDWRDLTKSGKKDAIAAKEDVEKNKGSLGVPWIGGAKKGGAGQKPIAVERDVVRAGYNSLAGRTATDTSSLKQNDATPGFSRYWKTPGEAEDWITMVIGETEVRTCSSCNRFSTKAGKGVYAYLDDQQTKTKTAILTLVKSNKPVFTSEELGKVSAPGMPVTQQVIEALKSENIYQDSLAEKLAEEVATTNVVEQLIAARQILIAGKRDAYVSDNKQAVEIIDERTRLIQEEMELIKQDIELRNATKQSVALMLLNRQSSRSETPRSGMSSDDSLDSINRMLGRQ
ncbi:integrating conjugative element protein [Vibrio fluvialis]|uniref:integrating conjugative element protein n=1 Tax=Vibrio fluvialis TaxID=676 RepID=UPI00192BDAE6|nr:integrating conjugative element protein [Vibrio fluvialis]MBL4262800.1 integrating conjugative element protein [Vibrio fluvialis]